VDMRQSDGQNSECGAIAVFPNSSARHSGYNAGLGWWGSNFGTGSPDAAKRGNTNGAISDWHTIRISVLQDGKVNYYLDGSLRHTDNDSKYTSGKIRLGNNCREFAYKNLKIVEIPTCPEEQPRSRRQGSCVSGMVCGYEEHCCCGECKDTVTWTCNASSFWVPQFADMECPDTCYIEGGTQPDSCPARSQVVASLDECRQAGKELGLGWYKTGETSGVCTVIRGRPNIRSLDNKLYFGRIGATSTNTQKHHFLICKYGEELSAPTLELPAPMAN